MQKCTYRSCIYSIRIDHVYIQFVHAYMRSYIKNMHAYIHTIHTIHVYHTYHTHHTYVRTYLHTYINACMHTYILSDTYIHTDYE
jgi:hypothetical protein